LVRALYDAGADVFRLNFSHGEAGDHRARHAAIRALELDVGHPIGILADLQGPKLRIGAFAKGKIELSVDQAFRFDLDKALGDAKRVSLPHPEIFQALRPGADLLLDDGRVRLTVERVAQDGADCRVVLGGELSDRKGVNLPGVVLPISPITPKDRRDLNEALALGVDWVALSFVQRPEDLAEARKLIAGRAAVLAKIEKPSAIARLEEIVEVSDALMVARGDLGVECPLEQVPGLQKRIVRAARRAGKPVVVATQMLDSMVHAAQPTRAEVSDVATAVYDGADAVMLSAESASGEYPVAAVATMDRIAATVERDPLYQGIMDAEHASPEATVADAITAAARQVANTIKVAAVVTYTASGSTALRTARERPRAPILSLTPSPATARRLALAWGVQPVIAADATGFADMVDKACRAAFTQGFAKVGERVVIIAGIPFGTPGATNVLHIAWVGDDKS
jgi:pyruvate kinase